MGVVDKVFSVIESHFGIDRDCLLHPSRGVEQWAYYRHIAIYCLWHYSSLKPVEIALVFNRDRSNLYHSIKYINEKCQIYPDIKKDVIAVESSLQNVLND